MPGPRAAGEETCAGSDAGHGTRGVDDLLHRKADTIAQIEHIALSPPEQMIQRQDMRLGQVGDVDVIPHTGAVLCGIILAENGHIFPLPVGHLEDDGHQMCLRLWPSPMAPEGWAPQALKYREPHI